MPNFPINVVEIEWAGGACPYQIEGTTDDGSYFYLRYRGGRFRAGVAKTYIDFWKTEQYNVIDIQHGDMFDGSVTHDEFMPLLEGKVVFPQGFVMDSQRYYSINQEPDPRDEI